MELHLPGEVPTAVPLWQRWLQQVQVRDWVCTWHSIPQLSRVRRPGEAQGQVPVPLVRPVGQVWPQVQLPQLALALVVARAVVAVGPA